MFNVLTYVFFYKKCKEGDLQKVCEFIEKDTDVNNNIDCEEIMDNFWNYGLHGAIRGGHMNIAQFILKKNFNIFNKDYNTNNSFWNENSWTVKISADGSSEEVVHSDYYANMHVVELILSKGTSIKNLPNGYTEYKKAKVLKFTKLHESLVDMILTYLSA